MGKIVCILGKSASGKDTIYKAMMADEEYGFLPVVTYTTRPMRDGETDGVQYHFCDKERMDELERVGRVIEKRVYDTVQGLWYYFTADDGSTDLSAHDYLVIGTLDSYNRLREYYGKDNVIPIYICLDEGERLARAVRRERMQQNPDYKELCRRYLADDEDFSDNNLKDAGIEERFWNMDLARTLAQIKQYLKKR